MLQNKDYFDDMDMGQVEEEDESKYLFQDKETGKTYDIRKEN